MKIKRSIVIILFILGSIALSSCNRSVPCPAYANAEQATEIVSPN